MRKMVVGVIAVVVVVAAAGCCPCLYCGSGGVPDVTMRDLSPRERPLPLQSSTTSQAH